MKQNQEEHDVQTEILVDFCVGGCENMCQTNLCARYTQTRERQIQERKGSHEKIIFDG